MPSTSTVKSALANLAHRLPASPTIVCVGGTSGIGEAIARKFTSITSKPNIHIVGRSENAANKIISDLKEVNPNGSYQFHACDLTLVSECKRLVQELTSTVDKIDYLVLSQGILTMAGRTETTEGNDKKFMLHYYSRIAVINGLLPKLHAGSRVMSVLDSLRGNPSKLNYEDLDLKNHYSLQNVMMHGITMNDIALQHLASKNPTVDFIHAYPGLVNTNVARSLPWYAKVPATIFANIAAVSPETCAEHLLYPLLVEDLSAYKIGGADFTDNKGDPVPNKVASTQEQQQKIWDHTLKIIKD